MTPGPSRRRALIGWSFPAVAGSLVAALPFLADAPAPVSRGIAAGVSLAVLQAYLSTGALRWAWNRRFFWWIWAGGVLFRLTVFVAAAFVVFRYTQFSFVATMASMVGCTTVFIVVESATCLKG